jgi:hypothetical protein
LTSCGIIDTLFNQQIRRLLRLPSTLAILGTSA